MKRRVQGELIETNLCIITFARTKIPNLIKLADWHHEIVQQYIPNPIRCNNYQRFDRTKKWCWKTDEICARVAELTTKLIIVQLNRDAQVAVELTLPITSGVMLSNLDVKLKQPWQESI